MAIARKTAAWFRTSSCPRMTTHLDVGEADLDYAMKFDHIDPANYVKVNMVDKVLDR